jgi:bifunctional DNA-binding transcriptional regulator/antitoxin component of YhaV-PrlF toxin-antitoxin module
MKLQVKPNGQAVITVPKSMRKAKGWEDGQELDFILNNEGDLVLKEVR